MKFFSKQEIIGVGIILVVLSVISFFNFRISLARARDAQRKNDLGLLTDVLSAFSSDFGYFPLSSEDGKILACKGPNTTYDKVKKVWLNLIACEWGVDTIRDLSDTAKEPYIKNLPLDPKSKDGYSYLYLSNGRRFQLYAALERKDQDEYDLKIVQRNLKCGNQICSFGKSYGSTPLDKSIQEYENELLEQEKNGKK